MHDPCFMALALIVSENDLNAKTRQKSVNRVSEKNDLNAKTRQKSVNRKSRSRLKIEHTVDLYCSR